jgi:GntR family transcriptional regulator
MLKSDASGLVGETSRLEDPVVGPVVLAPFVRGDRVPMHIQIHENLVLQLTSGKFGPGAELPAEAVLCVHYGVSRGTIRQALAELARDGLIERHPGRGSFLRRPKLEGNILGSYSQFLVEGPPLDRGARVLDCVVRKADPVLAKALGLGHDRSVVVLRRLRFAGGVPVTLQTSALPAALFPRLAKHNLTERHLVDVLRDEYGVTLVRAEEFIEPAICSAFDARQLGIKTGAPVFQIERRTFMPDGRIGEFRRAVMRGDVYRYRLDLR